MKANELMIGDWFRCTDPTPMKITAIDSWNMVVEDQEGFKVEVGDLQPIPLTEDILLKNGFESYEERYRLITADDAIFVEHIIAETNDFFWFTNKSRVFRQIKPSIVCNFNYVHEIQHLLRLCGLTDLADHFKV